MIFSWPAVNLRPVLVHARSYRWQKVDTFRRLLSSPYVTRVQGSPQSHFYAFSTLARTNLAPAKLPSQLGCVSAAFATSRGSSKLLAARAVQVFLSSQVSSTADRNKKGGKRMLGLVIGFGLGAIIGLGYYWRQKTTKVMPIANVDTGNDMLFTEPPPVEVYAKKFHNPSDNSGLQLTLFQYQPCPFCKKVRAFLDFSGLSYKIVEVNPVTKKQLGWSSYKKVPVLMANVPEGHQQLNDSSVIISTLYSYLVTEEKNLLKMVKCYPVIDYNDDEGKKHSDVMNRYFIMFGDTEPVGRSRESLAEERRWRQWSDNVLMHTISPNIYRTWDEALEAFDMFSKDGDWDRLFSSWERQVVIYVGAAAMYMIGKRLKKRHNLMADVRQSLYNEVNYFLKAVKAKGTAFLGGAEPNLADLAVYGCLNSMEGTLTFSDLLANTKIGRWYEAMRSVIDSRRAPQVAV